MNRQEGNGRRPQAGKLGAGDVQKAQLEGQVFKEQVFQGQVLQGQVLQGQVFQGRVYHYEICRVLGMDCPIPLSIPHQPYRLRPVRHIETQTAK